MNVKWEWVVGYEGLYKVSSDGDVVSVARIVFDSSGNKLYTKSEKYLKPFLTKQGYLRVILCKDAITKKYPVHRLVALAFIENPDRKRTVNHKNGIKTDNRLSNLEWMTHKENTIHAIENGMWFEPKHKIPYEIKKKVIEYYEKGSSERGCVGTAKKFNIGKSTVMNIVNEHNNEIVTDGSHH